MISIRKMPAPVPQVDPDVHGLPRQDRPKARKARYLLLVTNLSVGGAERAMIRYAATLMEANHVVTVLLLERKIDIPVPPGIDIQVLSEAPLRGGRIHNWIYAAKLRAWVKERPRYDACISTLPLMDSIAAAARLPNLWLRVANTLNQEIAAMGSRSKARRRHRRYARLYSRFPTIAVSDGVRHDLITNFGASPDRVLRIYSHFDFDDLERRADEITPDLPTGPYFVHVGRFSPQKRHDVLLNAFRQADLPHRLVLLTQPTAALHDLIARTGLGSRVDVVGFKDNPYPWMKNATALVLTSDREGMPNVLVEAIGCGTPVISTNCPSGPSEVLRGELARWLVPPRDEQALAAKMRDIAAVRPTVGRHLVADFNRAAFLKAAERLIEGGAGAR